MNLDDRKLQHDVIAALDADPAVDATSIGVAVREGVVTLSGHVADERDRRAALRATWQVAGVRAIAQQIDVRPPATAKTADDEIAARALRLLAWDLRLPLGALRVTVARGVVELVGTVDRESQRRDAERDVRLLHGVREVVNRIGLLSPPITPLAPRRIVTRRRFVAVRVADGRTAIAVVEEIR